jgi:hypothetical protein
MRVPLNLLVIEILNSAMYVKRRQMPYRDPKFAIQLNYPSNQSFLVLRRIAPVVMTDGGVDITAQMRKINQINGP